MKKPFLVTTLFFVISVNLHAQNHFWQLPNNTATSSYYDFGNQTLLPLPTIDPISGLAYADVYPNTFDDGGYVPSIIGHKGAANAISGPDGNLLFLWCTFITNSTYNTV